MPDEITIDGLEEHAFRRSIETLLRHGRADEAVERLKALLPGLVGEGQLLPERLLHVTTADVRFEGLDRIAAKLEEYGRAETPITAIGIGIGDPQDSGLAPDEEGNLRPPLETTYYSDATFPFSETDRDDLLEGYSSYGCEWQGDYDRIDDAISIEGIDDLYGAIATLENKVGASSNPSPDDIRAGAIGACYLGVLVYQAAREAVIRHGLPRPLAILLVNSDAYPFFDAPVLTCDEYRDDGAVKVVERTPVMTSATDEDFDADEFEESASLMNIVASSPHATKKKMALALEGDEAHNPLGMADELISQAAFDPGSVDLSRFMPQDSFEAEPPTGAGEGFDEFEELDWEPQTPVEDNDEADANSDFRELEFPVEALLPGDGDPHAPDGDAGQEISKIEPENPYLRISGEDTQESREDRWAAPLVPDADPAGWQDTESPVSPAEPAQEQQPCEERTDSTWSEGGKTGDFGAHMPWLEQEIGAHFDQGSSQPAPAAHSIRAKIRVSEPEEQSPTGLAGLLAAVARLIKRVQELLSRR